MESESQRTLLKVPEGVAQPPVPPSVGASLRAAGESRHVLWMTLSRMISWRCFFGEKVTN